MEVVVGILFAAGWTILAATLRRRRGTPAITKDEWGAAAEFLGGVRTGNKIVAAVDGVSVELRPAHRAIAGGMVPVTEAFVVAPHMAGVSLTWPAEAPLVDARARVRAWFDERTRRALAECAGWMVHVHDGGLVLSRPGHAECSAADLIVAATAAAALAGAEGRFDRRWQAALDHVGARPGDGDGHFVVGVDAVRVDLALDLDGAQPLVRVRAPRPLRGNDRLARVARGEPEANMFVGLVDARLAVDATGVTVELDAVDLDGARLERAIVLLATLVAPVTAEPYR
jgi:hypothetical protein